MTVVVVTIYGTGRVPYNTWLIELTCTAYSSTCVDGLLLTGTMRTRSSRRGMAPLLNTRRRARSTRIAPLLVP